MHTQMTLDLDIEERVDVRSLIVHGDIEREAPKAKREQPAPEFERVLADGADGAFRRRCGNRSQMLVLLVTQGQYYVCVLSSCFEQISHRNLSMNRTGIGQAMPDSGVASVTSRRCPRMVGLRPAAGPR